MPESSAAAAASTKRKKPPTFAHLPRQTAKKYKKGWVEKAKIKSKWKAQKRKEDLVSKTKLKIPVYDNDKDDIREGDEDEGTSSDAAKDLQGPSPRPAASHIHPSRAHIHPHLPVKHAKSEASPESKPNKKQRKPKDESEEADQAPSVRELMREAYSRSTLHTFKSDPLRRRGEGGGSRGRGQSMRGRGQPNMKLRMNAMLAKIKQDYT
ncbi:hypothetical protein NLJ89_g8189 [Agrocybe chaxingu]|uniref:rRNA-processing protein FYV7 n=1 Tax=Agrocybe chaxingu TaxID=84603 RepID=A0A9W8JUW9_9AGAR|nr:hypothetical protein NLJ89_g8189 [Agrocybe chaxingu]